MSPLNIEFYHEGVGKWVAFGTQEPGEVPGSITNDTKKGPEKILLECVQNDSHSVIYKQLEENKPKVIKILKRGQSHIMEIKTPRNVDPIKLRFTHK